jgi:multidrug efflux pump subunit AcrA (membrane-fusion protein)
MSPHHRFVRGAGALLVVAALLSTAACGRGKRPQRNTANATVPVVSAAFGTIAPTSTLSGTVAPLQNVAITSTLTEPADAVLVQEGDRVTRGQLLAQLDTADLQAQLAADLGTAASSAAKSQQTYAQAGLTIAQNSNSVNAAQAAVRAAQQTLANDELTLNRDMQLLKQGYIAQSQVDQQATVVKNDQQNVRSAQVTLQNNVSQVHANGTTSSGLQGAQVAAARADQQTALAQAQQVRVQIAKARIVSPIDGIVVNRNLNPGEFPGTRQIFTVQQVDRVYAVLSGSAGQIVGVQNGTRVQLTSSNLPGQRLQGTVVGVLNAVTPGSTNFVVKALIDNARGTLRPGMVVSGTAPLPGSQGIRIPVTAFLDTTDSSVQVVRDGVIHTVPVTTTGQDARNAVVVGLQPGETVVANGQLGLADGQPVNTEPAQVAHR